VAKLTGSRYAFNMLTAGAIRIVGATLHLALKDVSKTLTPDLVQATIQAAADAVKKLGIPNPRLAVAGLNPHCGRRGSSGGRRNDHQTGHRKGAPGGFPGLWSSSC